MIISSIDIGTNTILLLIADINIKNNKIIPLLNEYRIPRIGKNVNTSGKISKESIEKLKDIIFEYKSISQKFKSTRIIAAATAGFRKALNNQYIIDYILKETGIKIKVISGSEEALLAYLGVTEGLDDGKIKIVIDIGGGSTELIIGKGNKILLSKSFNIGVVTASELRKLKNIQFNQYSKSFFYELKDLEYIPNETYAIAGTPITIAAIKYGLTEFNEKLLEGKNLSRLDLKNFIHLHSYSSETYLKKYNKILSGRDDLIIPGAYILNTIMENLNLQEVTISTRGVRHGLIINHLNSYR